MLFPIFLPLGGGAEPDPQGRPFRFEVVMTLVLLASAVFAAWCVWHNLAMRDTFPLTNRYPDVWEVEDAWVVGGFFGFIGAVFVQFGLIGVYLGCRLLFRAATRGLRE